MVQSVQPPPDTTPPEKPPPEKPPPDRTPPDKAPPGKSPPDKGPPDKGPPDLPPPRIVRFDAAPDTLRARGETRLCFAAENARQAIIQPGNTQPTSANGGCVTRALSSSTSYTLIVRGSTGSQVQRTLTVRVEQGSEPEPPKPPVILRFDASPPVLKGPGGTQLCFAASNAQTATIQPGDPQPSSPNGGCVSRRLPATTAFTLTVTGKGAPPQQRRVVVEVAKPPGPTPGSEGPILKKPGDVGKAIQVPRRDDGMILKKPDAVLRKEIEVPKRDDGPVVR